MTVTDRTAAEALFLAAAEADAATRAALFAAAPPDVRAEAEALLRADVDAAAFFDRPRGLTLTDGPPVLPEAELEPGARVGPYRVEGVAGHGGMGTVYRASRADGLFEQTVALKLVRRGMASPDLMARAASERQTLARLQHSGIARLLGAGEADDGRPYLAMEYVDGEPLLAYAGAYDLSVDDRLRLFLQICDAVAAAHRALVVHRDLKPSNVLVTETPDGPRAVLLDFGIAKALDGDADLTRTAHRALTPAYAAPEQRSGGPITTAVDVWALGALLYELLTGARASDSGETTRTRASAAALLKPGGAALVRRLRGDLDAIVARALREEPEARYASPSALAEDVRRHLDGFPVVARQGTARYLAGRFVRRHRVAVAATVGLLVLAGTFVGLLVREQAETRAALARAEAEAANRAAVSDFLQSLMSAANPRGDSGPETPIGDVLREGAARAETELADQPLVLAALLDAIGNAQIDLGSFDEAEPLLERALDLRERAAGARSTETAASLQSLGVLEMTRGNSERADSLLSQALALREMLLPSSHPDLAHSRIDLGNLRDDLGDRTGALALLRQAIDDLRSDDPSVLLANALNDYGVILFSDGQFDAAETPLRESLHLRQRLLGPRHADVAISLTNVGRLYLDRGQSAEATPFLREAAAIAREQFGDEHWMTATIVGNEARAALETGRVDEAARIAQDILAQRRRLLPTGHPSIGVSLKLVGDVEVARGNVQAAESAYRAALAIFRDAYAEPHPNLANTLFALGTLLRENGREAEATPLLAEAAHHAEATLPPAHPRRREIVRAARATVARSPAG